MKSTLQTVLDVEERIEFIRLGLSKIFSDERSLKDIFKNLDYLDRGFIGLREIERILKIHPSPE